MKKIEKNIKGIIIQIKQRKPNKTEENQKNV